MPTGTNSAEIRITDVIAHPLTQRLPRPTVTSWGTYTDVSIVLVEVRTDAGITGVGEALARFSPKAYAELIETSLKPRLVGGNPTDIQAHWRTMRRALSGRAGGMLFEAISGVDIALWDILGKVAGLPVHRLLGGMGRTEVPVYAASVNWGSDEFMDRELDGYLEKGFPRIKIKIANPVKDACRRIARLRKRAGDDIELCVDANWAYTLEEAVEVGRALSDNALFLVRRAAAARGRGRLRRASPPMRHAACGRRKQLHARSGDAARRQPDALLPSAGRRPFRWHQRDASHGRVRCGA